MANFIQSAIKRPGALTRKAAAAGQSNAAWAAAHRSDSGLDGQEARFYFTLQSVRPKK